MGAHDTPIVVQTTAGSAEEAGAIASAIVAGRLAACVQIMPIESVYRWDGRIAREREWLLQCKTTDGRYAQLERTILGMHSYTTPEIVALPILRGSAAYLSWLAGETIDSDE